MAQSRQNNHRRDPYDSKGPCWCITHNPQMTLAEIQRDGHSVTCTVARAADKLNRLNFKKLRKV